jgi:23S rRNA pseudouridine1911/1915/1917 synthase
LLTQAPPGIDSLEVRVKRFLKTRDHKPGNVYLGVPHRIDRPASGALVLARHVRAARRLSEQFSGRTVEKIYWALLEGDLDCQQDEWTDTLRKIPGKARAEVVEAGHREGRSARLRYHRLARCGDATLVEIQLETGRTHQIRVQAATRGHPVLGDGLYGARGSFGPPATDPRDRWIALHARSLQFHHPMTRQRVRVVAPLPQPWLDAGIEA